EEEEEEREEEEEEEEEACRCATMVQGPAARLALAAAQVEQDGRLERSRTPAVTTLSIHGGSPKDTLTLPVETRTTVWDIKLMLAFKTNRSPEDMTFVVKQGCSWRVQYDHEEVGRKVVVKGIRSFQRERFQWHAPIAVIGSGHAGLRQALFFLKHNEHNFVVYDRKAKVGGMAWQDSANDSSKLQTEMGCYHLQYDEDNPVPTDLPTWPSRAQLLRHFEQVAEEYGVMKYCRMCTNVKEIIIENTAGSHPSAKSQAWTAQTYRLVLEPTDGSGDGRGDHIGATGEACYSTDHCGVIVYPGNLAIPRREVYAGEDLFGCPIAYGIWNDFDYKQVDGKDICIVGHGAFALENIRTCLEYNARKIYLVCRKKNLAMPRVTSWLINQSQPHLSTTLCLDSMKPMYQLAADRSGDASFDPWVYHSVHANKDRTHVTISQKARFGIGDMYFLAIAMGVCEVVLGKIKRLTPGCVHLESGREFQAQGLLKLLGFYGNFDIDRLVQIKTMHGWWANEDFRRCVISEATGVDASNFGGTSFSPSLRSWVEQAAVFFWFPSDWQKVVESGMLPTHSADPEANVPAYVVDARHGTTTFVVLESMIPFLMESSSVRGLLKRRKQLECHPLRTFVEEARAEWEQYAEQLRERAPLPPPRYPYDCDSVQALVDRGDAEAAAAAARP
ncbi:unnamed protein product, partial [Prorocentrum cordatum]